MSASITVKREARSASASRPVSLRQTTDLRDVTVLSKDDFARIQFLIKKQQLEKDTQQQALQEKEAVRQRSKELVQDWDDTIQKKYQKRLEAREKRFADIEKERQKVDVEEMKVQAEKRRQALEVAKKKQYYETDRVKSFHSAYLLTEVLREREAQIELRNLKGSHSNNMDAHFLEVLERDNQAAMLKERDAAAKRIREARQHSADLKAQIKQRLVEKHMTTLEKQKEGEEIERLRMQYLLEQERLKQIGIEEKRLQHDDYMKQMEDVRKMRELERQREDDEEDECRVFASAKRKMMQLRAQREAEIQTNKLAELARIKDKLSDQLKAIKSDEQGRLDRAQEEAEQKFLKDEQTKKENRQATLHEMDMFRKAKENQLAKGRAEERERDAEMLKMRLDADRLFKLNELEKRRRNREEAQHITEYQQRQAAVIRDRFNTEKEAELRDAKLQEKVLELEEDQFQRYATAVIDDAKKNGKNVYPLEQAARPRPGFAGLGPQLPGRTNYLTDDQVTQEKLEAIATKKDEELQEKLKKSEKERKRLGMVW